MPSEKENPASGQLAGSSLNTSSVGVDGLHISQNVRVAQAEIEEASPAPLPTFFDLVADNCLGHLQRIARYCEALGQLAEIGDYGGYVAAGDKLLGQNKAFAELFESLKQPSISRLEMADRLEKKARGLRDRAKLLDSEASRLRLSGDRGGDA